MKFKIRGTNILGIELIISPENLKLKDIEDEVLKRKQILRGARLIISLIDTRLSEDDIRELKTFLDSIEEIRFCGFKTNLRENRDICTSLGIPCDILSENVKGMVESLKVKFIKKTLRSGDRVSFSNDIAILGDVNPGAEVEAGGNIYIFGSLRGIAKAGIGRETGEIRAMFAQTPKIEICGVSYPFEKDEKFFNFKAVYKHGKINIKEGRKE